MTHDQTAGAAMSADPSASPQAFRHENTAVEAEIARRPSAMGRAFSPTPVVATTPMILYRVLVTERLSSELVESTQGPYLSPPQTEQEARSLIRLLVGSPALEGGGPWRQVVAGGQRIIELCRES
jgi:hypothetical protein